MARARVVLADDHPEFLAHTQGLLDEEFDVVQTFTDGQSLLDAAEEVDPDVFLLDLSMPGLSGLETARRLKAAGSHAKVIFLTVQEDPDFVRSARAIGADGYVLKRRMLIDLTTVLKEVLAGSPGRFPPGT